MQVLIDSDIACYRAAAVTENESEATALLQVDQIMHRIIAETGAGHYTAFLTGPGNFRYDINPEYKANRKDVPKPTHLKACQQFIMDEWQGVWCTGWEADDAMGFSQRNDTCIATIDKDLLMIPGYHYNFVSGVYQEVSYLQGIKHFYKQMLIGDVADNIKGMAGIGKVKAGKLIDPLKTEQEMYEVVCNLYKDVERFDMNADCLWIWRQPGQRFTDRNSFA